MRFTSPSFDDLKAASSQLQDKLVEYRGLSEITDSFESAKAETDLAKAAGILEFAAWHLDSIILHVDGQAGESDTAHEDDWLEDATSTAAIHGLALQARTEVFRARREP